jgi:hypothetical protein
MAAFFISTRKTDFYFHPEKQKYSTLKKFQSWCIPSDFFHGAEAQDFLSP